MLRPPTSGLLHKLPMLGKLFSFSGKSSLYRTGSARCSTTLRGIVPKTEANLLMHSDLGGLGRAVGQKRGTGVGNKENVQEAESENTSYSTLARETQGSSTCSRVLPTAGRLWRNKLIWGYSISSEGERELGMLFELFEGHGPAEVRVSFPSPSNSSHSSSSLQAGL